MGVGIASEDLSHLFERFYRVEAARSRSFSGRESRQAGGTSLGLAIAYEIVRLHGGMMKLESVLDRGTTFTISLPIKIYNSNISQK